MYEKVETESSRVRAGLGHPVIDCDAHWIQPGPILRDYIEKVAGSSVADAWISRSPTGIGMGRVLRNGDPGVIVGVFGTFRPTRLIGQPL